MTKEFFGVLSGSYHLHQKVNYLKYLFSKKSAYLNYRPLTISVVATGSCTLACDMCPTHSRIVPKDYRWRQTTARDMEFGLFKKSLDLFEEALNVHIIGSGEPMLNKDFFKMVNYAHTRKKMTVKSFTNGTTIMENMDRLLYSELDGLTISINGHNKHEFSRLTGMPAEAFKTIYTNTKELIRQRNAKGRRLRINLSFIIDKSNIMLMPEMEDFAVRIGADHVFFCNFLPSPYEGLTPVERIISDTDRAAVSFIRHFRESLPPERRKKIAFPFAIDGKRVRNKCDIHFRQIRIDGEGNVSSCSMMLLNMENAGSINDKDPWNCGYLLNIRKKVLQGRMPDELCSYCPSNKGIEIQ